MLQVGAAPPKSPVEHLVEHLRGRSLLLIFDNFEQVLGAPALRIRTFSLSAESAPAVAELCARLDGLPLAIELAAAWVKLLSPQSAARPTAQSAHAADRWSARPTGSQQTLRPTFDWSFELLAPAEQLLFARLAVFVGGCSLEALDAIGAEPGRPADQLQALTVLVEHGLLRRAEPAADEPRFDMLETVREYAAERLEGSGEADTWRQRHAEYFLELVERAGPALLMPDQDRWFERLEREHDNLRAALGWAIATGNAALGLRLAVGLERFWAVRGHLVELTIFASLMHAPPAPHVPPHRVGELVLSLLVCFAGGVEDGQRAMAPLRRLAEAVADTVRPIPYPTMYDITADYAAPFAAALRSMFADDLSDDVLDAALAAMERATSPYSFVEFRGLGGAMARVPSDATAFAHRQRRFMVSIIGVWLDAAEDAAPHRAWVESLWQAIRHTRAGVYVHFLQTEGDSRVREAYPPATYARLAAIKQRYDPTNLFRHNQNIRARS